MLDTLVEKENSCFVAPRLIVPGVNIFIYRDLLFQFKNAIVTYIRVA